MNRPTDANRADRLADINDRLARAHFELDTDPKLVARLEAERAAEFDAAEYADAPYGRLRGSTGQPATVNARAAAPNWAKPRPPSKW